jgi:heavy metal sensor kinase
MKFFQNIRVRLTSWYLLIVALLVALFGTVGYFMLVDGLSRNIVTPFDMRVADITTLPDGSIRVIGFTSVTGKIGAEHSQIVVQVPVSRLLEDASENGTIQIKIGEGGPILVDKDLLLGDKTTSQGRMMAYLFISPNNPSDSKLVVAGPSETVQASTIGVFKRTILIAAVVTLLVAAILGFFLVSRMLRPVQAITRTAREIEENNLDRRLKVNSKDELGELASTLNQAFARLEAAFVREREFTADASHELRTPLAIAQGEASLALREERTQPEYRAALESISRQISRTSSIISRLLFLARADDRLEMVMTDVNLNELLAEVASDAQVLCAPKRITVRSELTGYSGSSDALVVRADTVRLRELFLNLLDNAVRYTPEGGTISISLDREGDFALAAVADTGIGIPNQHLINIFRRFYRVDKSRSRAEGGVGLGLAIGQRIAEVHGGRIEVKSKVGEGSTFNVFLPLSR